MLIKNNRFFLLDFFRGFAALSVAIFHYKIFYSLDISVNSSNVSDQPYYSYIKIIYEFGWIAVQFFFLLSGFIFYEIYLEKIHKKTINFKNFFILRFSRLYPIHLFSLIIIIVLFYLLFIYGIKNPLKVDSKHLVLNLFLIHSWGLEDFASFNIPSWSISIEALLYLIFFLIVRQKNFFVFTFCFFLISPVIFLFNKLLGYGFFCFFLGGIVSLLNNKFLFLKKKNFIIFLFFSLFISIILSFNTIIQKILLLVIFFPSLILISIKYNNNKIFHNKFFSYFGDISYSIYLIHYPIQILTLCVSSLLNIEINFNNHLVFLSYIIFLILVSHFIY
jgi:peptidoglycan/LPS O-acetylase OafA/YrhL